jgi:hypothetical protein
LPSPDHADHDHRRRASGERQADAQPVAPAAALASAPGCRWERGQQIGAERRAALGGERAARRAKAQERCRLQRSFRQVRARATTVQRFAQGVGCLQLLVARLLLELRVKGR